MQSLGAEQWSPYLVGGAIGILSWIAFLLSDKPIGCSTAFARTGGMIERIFRGSKTMERPYYRKFAPTVDWEWMLVLGVVMGAFISANLSGSFELTWVPTRWMEAFGEALTPRLVVALLGGILMGVGSRWAGGCTSGHGISGTLQLAASSWLAAIIFFAGGTAAALAIFGV